MIRKLQLKTLLLCCLAFGILQTKGQGWMKKYPAHAQIVTTSVYPGAEGGYLLTGFTFNNYKEHTMKIDANGDVVWAMDYDSVLTGSFSNTTQDGGLVILGYSKFDTSDVFTRSVLRIDKDGNKKWLKAIHTYHPAGHGGIGNVDIDTTDDGGFICTLNAYDTTAQNYMLYVKRLDGNGNILWTKTYYDTDTFKSGYALRNAKDGGFIMAVSLNNVNLRRYVLIKLDSAGNKLWEYDPGSPRYFIPSIAHDGNIFLSMGEADSISTLIKLNQQGNILWQHDYNGVPDNALFSGPLIENQDGSFAILAVKALNGINSYTLCKADTLGNILYAKKISIANLGPNGRVVKSSYKTASATLDGGYVIGGMIQQNSGTQPAFLIKTDGNGAVYPSSLSGNTFYDDNQNCIKDTNEIYIRPVLITFTGATDTFTVSTIDSGYYSLGLDPANYNVHVVPPSPYWQSSACNPGLVNLPAGSDSSILFGLRPNTYSPYITISGHLSRQRLCNAATYTAQYCNTGTAPFTGAIDVEIDTFLHIDSASTPWSAQHGNVYTFPIPPLPAMECATLTIFCTVTCDQDAFGRTVCVDAHAYQDTVVNVSPLWDQSNLEMGVDYAQGTDTITFTLTNRGSGSMGSPKGMIVIEDNVILITTPIQLTAGAHYQYRLRANGATWRATIPQTDFNPYSAFTTAAIEGAGTNQQGQISLGYYNQFPNNGYYGYHYNTCAEIVNSVDPNEKTVTPKGAGTDHLIDSTTVLVYTIDFQNTGTDTAWLVRITDTLAPYLDPATIKPGVSSSPYEMQILGKNVLQFTFYNINLPDSGANQQLSNGFVTFSIAQKAGNTKGTVVNNKAAIYFDYNAPVVTNTATVRIGKMEVMDIENLYSPKQVFIKAFPNPFNYNTTIQVEGEQFDRLLLNIYNAGGKLVKQQRTDNATQFILERGDLDSGNYIFEIIYGEKIVGRGKIAAQ